MGSPRENPEDDRCLPRQASKVGARILGFTMIGSEAGEVMSAVQTAMLARLPYQQLRDAVIAHLTMAEGLGPLLSNVGP
jgi:pyruvate/2-oxoglutarate dehydrogenase complex dihydrolipoamide dehydrogenase (E3) component